MKNRVNFWGFLLLGAVFSANANVENDARLQYNIMSLVCLIAAGVIVWKGFDD